MHAVLVQVSGLTPRAARVASLAISRAMEDAQLRRFGYADHPICCVRPALRDLRGCRHPLGAVYARGLLPLPT
jgi:hypothetical protein